MDRPRSRDVISLGGWRELAERIRRGAPSVRISIAAALLALSACQSTPVPSDTPSSGPSVPTAQIGEGASDPARQTVRLTVISRYNPRLMVGLYQPMVGYLSEHTPLRFDLVLSRDYTDAVDRICSGDVEMASLGGLTYLQAESRCGARPLVRPRGIDGEPFYRSVFVVAAASPVRELSDLRGRRVAFASPWSTSGALVPIHELLEAGITLDELAEARFTGHHDSALKAVLRGDADAAAVKDASLARFRGAGLRILHASVRIPSVPIVTTRDCPDSIRDAVRAALLSIDPEDPQTMAEMSAWDPEFSHGFVSASSRDYDSLREMMRECESQGYRPGHWVRGLDR